MRPPISGSQSVVEEEEVVRSHHAHSTLGEVVDFHRIERAGHSTSRRTCNPSLIPAVLSFRGAVADVEEGTLGVLTQHLVIDRSASGRNQQPVNNTVGEVATHGWVVQVLPVRLVEVVTTAEAREAKVESHLLVVVEETVASTAGTVAVLCSQHVVDIEAHLTIHEENVLLDSTLLVQTSDDRIEVSQGRWDTTRPEVSAIFYSVEDTLGTSVDSTNSSSATAQGGLSTGVRSSRI